MGYLKPLSTTEILLNTIFKRYAAYAAYAA